MIISWFINREMKKLCIIKLKLRSIHDRIYLGLGILSVNRYAK